MCKTKCNCVYRVKEDIFDGSKVYYPEYAHRLFPWRWKRLDIVSVEPSTGKSTPIHFRDKTTAEMWLNNFRLNKDPILSDRYYS
jgi:hypothetical protein